MQTNKNYIFVGLFAVISLLLLEAFLWIAALASPMVSILLSPKYSLIAMPDATLIHRPTPYFPTHDKNGFRNKYVPLTADIIGMGDSQTYGTGVEASSAWPKQLQTLSHQEVYSMAFGGWGPVEEMILLDEALALKPKRIIQSFYSGNDLMDCYELVYKADQYKDLKTQDPKALQAIEEEDKKNPIFDPFKEVEANKKRIADWNLPFYKKSKLYWALTRIVNLLKTRKSIINSIKNSNWEKIKSRYENNPNNYIVEKGDIKTVLTPAHRLKAQNSDDPRIREGLEIALKAITLSKSKVRSANVEYWLVLIPTKELVFKDLVFSKDSVHVPELYKRQLMLEEALFHDIKQYLSAHNILYIDLLPALRKSLEENKQPYQINDDGHPNEAGHLAMARAIYISINRVKGEK